MSTCKLPLSEVPGTRLQEGREEEAEHFCSLGAGWWWRQGDETSVLSPHSFRVGHSAWHLDSLTVKPPPLQPEALPGRVRNTEQQRFLQEAQKRRSFLMGFRQASLTLLAAIL